MDYRFEITAYEPVNEQERKDRRKLLNYLDTEENLLTRENEKAHFSVSSWVMNQDFTKVLMAYHNIYQSWSWLGGHMDGETDFLGTAIREVQEESGLAHLKPASPHIFSLEILDVPEHTKNGKKIAAHEHLNLTYLLVGDEKEPLQIKPDENSALAWMALEEAVERSTEPEMQSIYRKLNRKAEEYKNGEHH